MVINDLIKSGAEILETSVENPLREARLIFSHVSGMSVSDVIIRSGEDASDEICEKFFIAVKNRADKMPFAYITGKQSFFGLDFFVDENVLIPRADTETLVETALSAGGKNVLDLCTGSGCIAIALAKNMPESHITAVDVSENALEIAKKNAASIGCSNISFLHLDILSEIPCGMFDLIVSNPPYIETAELSTLMKDVISYEPSLALDGGEDGLIFYRRICAIAPQILNPGGVLAFEIGYNQYESVYEIMAKNFKDIDFKTDLAGIKRVIFGKLQ